MEQAFASRHDVPALLADVGQARPARSREDDGDYTPIPSRMQSDLHVAFDGAPEGIEIEKISPRPMGWICWGRSSRTRPDPA
jgi:hypothetical protein